MSRSNTSKAGRKQHRGVRPRKQGGTVWIGHHGSDGWKFAGRIKGPLTLEFENVDVVDGSVRRVKP